jgi:uncharacterized Tic20 family protein
VFEKTTFKSASMDLGKKITLLRKNKSISQESLADSSGISLRTIQRIEVNVEELHFVEGADPNTETDHKSIDVLRLINSSALIVLVLPVFNIIIPFILWYKNKRNLVVYTIGKQIISFQILWCVLCLFLLLATPFLHYTLTGSFINGRMSPLFLVYLSMLLVNILFVVFAALKLKDQKIDIYGFVPSLF